MENIGISLGWNCYPASYGVNNGFREKKSNGYLTCPFDEMISNIDGVTECIKDNFKYLCDSNYLKIVKSPFAVGGINKHENLLYNIKYNFIFNHESPGHAELYLKQNWSGGINHYIDNDFYFFKKRYLDRINNFNNYVDSGKKIIFIISGYNLKTNELENVLKNKAVNYELMIIKPNEGFDMVSKHHELMYITQ